MNLVNLLFTTVAILLGCLLWMIVNSDRSTLQRWFALFAGFTCLGTGFFAMTELLARPKPVGLEWLKRTAVEATVHSTVIREGEAIYVWLEIPGDPMPKAYQLEWSEQNAIAMHKAQQSAEQHGTRMRMRKPFTTSSEKTEPQFYAPPPPASPPKQISVQNTRVFNGTQ